MLQIRRKTPIYVPCKHKVDSDNARMGATCIKCHRMLGWKCTGNSPDGVCHYFSSPSPTQPENFRMVKLITNEIKEVSIADLSEWWSLDDEHLDKCIFCAEPEERK